MKYTGHGSKCPHKASRPARGGWIEIFVYFVCCLYHAGPAPHGAGGLKCFASTLAFPPFESRPARGGWIEIDIKKNIENSMNVPPRTGRVD